MSLWLEVAMGISAGWLQMETKITGWRVQETNSTGLCLSPAHQFQPRFLAWSISTMPGIGPRWPQSNRKEPRSSVTSSGTSSGCPAQAPVHRRKTAPSFSKPKSQVTHRCSWTEPWLRATACRVWPFSPLPGFEKRMSSDSASVATGRDIRKGETKN